MDRNVQALRILGWITGLGYVAVAVLEVVIDSDEELGSRIGFPIFLVVLAVALMAGVQIISKRPRLGAVVASLSALVGAFVLFWTVLAIMLGVAIIVLSVVVARGGTRSDRVSA